MIRGPKTELERMGLPWRGEGPPPDPEPHFIVKYWGFDVKECVSDGKYLIHILNPNDNQIDPNDKRIEYVKEIAS